MLIKIDQANLGFKKDSQDNLAQIREELSATKSRQKSLEMLHQKQEGQVREQMGQLAKAVAEQEEILLGLLGTKYARKKERLGRKEADLLYLKDCLSSYSYPHRKDKSQQQITYQFAINQMLSSTLK